MDALELLKTLDEVFPITEQRRQAGFKGNHHLTRNGNSLVIHIWIPGKEFRHRDSMRCMEFHVGGADLDIPSSKLVAMFQQQLIRRGDIT
jgi:hypothetical protein